MRVPLVVALGLLLLAAVASADIPKLIGYQGRVTDNGGNPVSDGQHTMRFRLYDAATAGNQIWDSGEVLQNVTAGVFNALLGAAGQPTLDLDFAADYWLLVSFEGEDITPRQRLTSVGYAYMASGVTPGTEVSGLVAGGAALTGTNTASSGVSYGLVGESRSGAGRGVVGIASSTAGQTYGVYGSTGSPTGYGVYSQGDAKIVGQIEVEEFKMPTGAAPGYVLKSDATGVGSWQAAADDDGDWEIAGADLYAVPPGNVGVGTTSPGGKLHIKANTWGQAHLYLENPTYGHTRVLQASGGLVFRNYGATGTNYAYGFRDSSNASLMVIRADGNVGIGVGTPLEKLMVAGTVQAEGFRMPTGSADGYVLKSDGSGEGTWQPGTTADGDWTVAGDGMHAIPSGNVGIGTVSPAGKLHVTAASWGQPNLVLENPSCGSTGVLQASSGLLFRNYDATGTDLAYGFRDSTNTTLMSIRADGNLGVGVVNPLEKLVVNGTAQVQGFKLSTGAHIGWVLTSDGGGVGTWQPPGGAVGDGDWYMDGNHMYSIPSGNVGVGVATPAEKLDVDGTAQIKGFKMPTGAASGYVLKSDASGVGTWQAESPDGDWQVSGISLYSLPPGNVGVGVVTPSEKLDVAGTAQVQGFKMPTGAAIGYVLKSDGSGVGTWQPESPDGDWQVSGSTMYSLPAGNVGIGINTPAQKLHVAGNIRLNSGGNIEFAGTSTRIYESSGAMRATADGSMYLQPDDDVYVGADGASPWVLFDNGLQRLGVGTMSPSARVHAETSVDPAALRGVNTTPSGTTYGIYGQAASTSGYGVYSDGNAKVDGDLEVNQTLQVGDSLGVANGLGVQHTTRAIYGEATALTGISYGGRFQAASASGRGLYGLAASTLGAPIGVYGACNSTMGYGVYFTGGLAGTGTKSCVVKTSSGPTLLYCQESPECWFEDFGEGKLVNGRAHLELDRLFLETVTIDAGNPMKVFVQLHDETCRGVAVKKARTGFDVVELEGGTSNGTFDYRVVAKRKGYENDRLELCAAAEADPSLSADKTTK